jgi:hypothetical protein
MGRMMGASRVGCLWGESLFERGVGIEDKRQAVLVGADGAN